jgi:hypothetical protein
VLALAAAGCGGSRSEDAVVVNRPAWPYEEYRRLAVLPGRAVNPEGARFSGLLSEQLEAMLSGSGAFEVLTRTRLREVFAEQDLSKLADDIDAGTTLPDGQIRIAQAIVSLRLTDFRLIRERVPEVRPVFARDPRGVVLLDRFGRPIVVGERREWIFRHGCEAEASVRVIDAATSQILFSHAIRAPGQSQSSRGGPPRQSPEDMAAAAMRNIAAAAYRKIAPTRVRVEFKSDMLLIASDYFDGRYREAKRIRPDSDDFIIAVRELPEVCDGNAFRVAVSAEGGRENLAEQEFLWGPGVPPEGVQLRVPTDLLVKAGGERFVAKLYSVGDPAPKLEKSFRCGAEN